MRNYIFARGIQYRAFIFDDMHVQQGDFPVYAIGQNNVDLLSQQDVQNKLVTDSLPLNWTAEFVNDHDPITIYFLLDKDSLFVTFQSFAAQYVGDAMVNQPTFYPMLVNPEKTPRNTGWKDPAGIIRNPPPSETKGLTLEEADFSGAQGLLDALAALPELAAKLTRAGRLRDAGIVLYAYHQVINGTWAIDRAFDYLAENGLA
jgi:hypothetical protein